MESHFLALMPHTVTTESVDSYTDRGDAQYGAATDIRALVTPTRQRIVRANGSDVVARGVAYCAGPLTVAEDVVITVPAAFGLPERMTVLRTGPYTALDGSIHNVEVWF